MKTVSAMSPAIIFGEILQAASAPEKKLILGNKDKNVSCPAHQRHDYNRFKPESLLLYKKEVIP